MDPAETKDLDAGGFRDNFDDLLPGSFEWASFDNFDWSTEAGGSVLWRMPIDGSPLGFEKFDEILAIYYPSNQAFLNIRSLPSSDENYHLRDLAVADAQLLRCTDLPKQWKTS